MISNRYFVFCFFHSSINDLVTGIAFLNNEGSALYSVQSKANHSCTPNVQASFPASNHVLHLVALKDISAGKYRFIFESRYELDFVMNFRFMNCLQVKKFAPHT